MFLCIVCCLSLLDENLVDVDIEVVIKYFIINIVKVLFEFLEVFEEEFLIMFYILYFGVYVIILMKLFFIEFEELDF